MKEEITATTITLASYNLHGVQDNDAWRYREIARGLAACHVDICGFQEVIKGNGIEDTSFQVARHLKDLTGHDYHTYWAYCHPFYEKYPEGVSLLSRFPIENPRTIDLDVTLRKGTKPLMARYAAGAEFTVQGRKILFASLHLDHHSVASIRTAQAAVLLRGLCAAFTPSDHDAVVLTGDFNARENSMCLRYLKRRGFIDTYRHMYRSGGATFPAWDPLERIDYIMVKGTMAISSSFLMPGDRDLSDHLGLVTILSDNPAEKGNIDEPQ